MVVIQQRSEGRFVGQAVNRRLPTVAVRVRAQGFVADKVAMGKFFSEYSRFPLQILIPPTAPLLSSIIRGWYNRPKVAYVPSGLSLAPPHGEKTHTSREK
jgi:hypothetical protein